MHETQQISMLNVLSILKLVAKGKSWERQRKYPCKCVWKSIKPNELWNMWLFSVSFRTTTIPKRMLTYFVMVIIYYFFCWQSHSFSLCFRFGQVYSHLAVSRNALLIEIFFYVVFLTMLLNCKQLHWTKPNTKICLCQWCDVNEIIRCIALASLEAPPKWK